MDRLDGITMRIGTGYRYLNIDGDGEEIGHIHLAEDGTVSGVWAESLSDKVWIRKIADFCQTAIKSAETLRRSADPRGGEA